jgi:hypothetical protein
VSSLPTDAQGVVRITVPVAGDASPTVPGNWTANLGCRPGGCADVYPLKVTLVDNATGSAPAGAHLVTYLLYDSPAPRRPPQRLALVVPVGLPPPVADRTGHVAAPPAAAVTRLDGLLGALAGGGEVPLTVIPDPATVQSLASSGHAHAISALAALSASPARQTLSESFVPVDPSALADAGLSGELADQLHRAATVLDTPALDVRSGRGTWVAGGTLDGTALGALASDYTRVVVPPGALSGSPFSLTATQPFTLTSGRGPALTGAVSDPALSAHLAAGAGTDPALAAVQMLAETSLVYYEGPNLSAPRGVVAVAPSGWAPDPGFVTALLGGLQGDPVVAPVTLDELFAQVPAGANRQPAVRHPATVASGAPLPARAIRAARAQVQAFTSAVSGSPAGDAVEQGIDDLLLASESSLLSARQQQVGLAGLGAALGGQLRLVSIRSDTVRLTSGAASVPITVLRSSSYPVTAVLTVTSDKLVFPRAPARPPDGLCRPPVVHSSAGRSSYAAVCVLDHSTTAVYVDMRSRTSGDFRIDVTLAAPEGNLVLASGQLTVRSMSTSAVAILLSLGAAVVLLAWWGRTLWRSRWARRGAHGGAPHAGGGRERPPDRASS